MAIPQRFVFKNDNKQIFQWGQLVDGLAYSQGLTTSIPDATVIATLYKNRVSGDDTRLGTAALTFGTTGSLVLLYASAGIYRGFIAATFHEVVGPNYVLVVTAQTPGGAYRKWEIKAEVTTG